MLGICAFFSAAHKKRTGMVKIAPAAKDSPAEPIVCTILLSRIVSSFFEEKPPSSLYTPIPITAAGIDAETVIPTRSPRYALAAPKTIARIIPIRIDETVNSGNTLSALT